MKKGKNHTRQKIMRLVLSNSELSTATKLVFCALVEECSYVHAREPGERELDLGQVAITVKELSEKIGMNLKTVSKSLQLLVKKGLIRKERREKYHYCAYRESVFEIAWQPEGPKVEDGPLKVPRLLRGAHNFLTEAQTQDDKLRKFTVKLEDGHKLSFWELLSWLDVIAEDYEKNGPQAQAAKLLQEKLKGQRPADQ